MQYQKVTTLEIMTKQSILTSDVIVDYREVGLIEVLKARTNVVISNLDVDVIIGEIAIERKTSSDFEQSIIDGRLFDQINILKNYGKGIIALEIGFPERVHVNSYYGAIARVLKEGVSILHYRNLDELANIIDILARQNDQSPRIHISKNTDDPVRNVIMSIPGIGKRRTDMIMERFSSLREFFNSDIDTLKNLLGKSVGEKVYRLINDKYK
ncbi:MAG: ERCC4 domain-containing protein [Candidatus Anstonellales archaeon]